MTTTPKLGIPLISSQQSQPEVTHNQMVVLLQALAGGAIDERNAPPGSPAAGDCYIIGGAGSGLWAGHNHAIAIYYGGWNFIPGFDDDGVVIPMSAAQNGLSIFNNDTAELWAWQTSSWIVATGGTGASRLIDLLDVNVSETATEDGDFLAWDQASGLWVPRPIVIPSEGVPALKDLSDVAVGDTSTQDGDFLVWDDSIGKWVAMAISFPSDGVPLLSDLPDVNIVAPADGDVLTYDGVSHKWVAEPGGAPISSSGAGSKPAPTYTNLLTPGTGNYNPPNGCTRIEVEFKGAGAGGTGSGTAGGPLAGGTGGDAIFAGYHAAGGPTGGNNNFPAMGGFNGADGVGAISVARYSGNVGQAISLVPWSATTYAMYGGNGAGNGAGRTAINANDGLAARDNSGAGGGGAGFGPDTLAGISANLSYGGGGAEAERRILQFNNPVGPIAWTVPAGGTAGPAGTGGHAGGVGGSGYIRIKEFYGD